MKVKTLRTRIWIWKQTGKALYLIATLNLFFSIARYHLLCFRHFGRRRALIFLLQTPEHLRAVGLALFTHGAPLESRQRSKSERGAL